MPQDPLEEVRQIHRALWESTPPPASVEEAQQRLVVEQLRSLSMELVHQGVTTAILEGAFLLWWLQVACLNHGFAEGGFERCLVRIGPVMQPIVALLNRLGEEIQDEGPLPEMVRLGEKLEQARDRHGWGGSWPESAAEEKAQTQLAHERLHAALQQWLEAGVSPGLLESRLLYYWFRATAINRSLKESFFQKLERNWDQVTAPLNQHLDEQAAADRRRT